MPVRARRPDTTCPDSLEATLGAVGFGAAKAPAAGDDGTSFMPGIETQRAFDLIDERFPGSDADGADADARIVFIASEGHKVTASEDRAAIGQFVSEVADQQQVDSAVSPFRYGAVGMSGRTGRAYAASTGASPSHALGRGSLAYAAGLAPSTVAKLEQGGNVRIETLHVLARALHVKTSQLMASGTPQPVREEDPTKVGLVQLRNALTPPVGLADARFRTPAKSRTRIRPPMRS